MPSIIVQVQQVEKYLCWHYIMHLSLVPVNFTLAAVIFCNISEVKKCTVSNDTISFYITTHPFFLKRRYHIIVEKYIFVVSRESPLYPWETSSTHTLGAVDALRIDVRWYVSVEYVFMRVIPLLKNSSVSDGEAFEQWRRIGWELWID